MTLSLDGVDHRVSGPWHDSSTSPESRAAALLAEMTPAEKLAQLGSSWPGAEDAGGDVAPMQDTVLQAEALDQAVVDGLGHLTRAFGTAPIEPAEGVRRLADLQRQVVSGNRFGIPAIAHEECLTGFTTWKATVYPTALAWAATFDPALVREMAAAIGEDMASVGVHQGLSPVLDVVRDYRWGRVEETLGEDPYLVAEMGCAYVEGLQSSGVVATLKHFAGYSTSQAARNHAPAALGRRELADVILPPFERAVVASGVRSVMNSYSEIDGVPAGADPTLLTGLLRETWQFDGTVVSDYWAVPFLHTMHRIADSSADAGAQALSAGIDVELPHTLGYGGALLDALESGAVDPAVLDRAALRVLTQKAELGLLDADWTPTETDAVDLDSRRNRDLARRLAEESIVLLENRDSLLPLRSPSSIAVIGPGADDAGCFFGCYSFPNHVVPNHPGTAIGVDAPTLLEGIAAEFSSSEVRHERGAAVIGDDRSGIEAAAALAERSELTVLVVGDRSGMFGHGTSGEGCDVTSLELPGVQDELARAVLAASRRVVLVVLSGRPYAIGGHAARAAATLQVFFPGEEGASAIAGVLSGRVSPSGRLPVQIPGDHASHPSTYLAPPLARKSDGVSNIDPTPAYPFGFGRSYGVIETVAARIDQETIGTDGVVTVTATFANSSDTEAWHVAQLYLTDPVATVTRPVRRLVGYTRLHLEPGTSCDVSFAVHADITSFTGRDRQRRVEPGLITLTVADDAGADGTPLDVLLLGPVRHVDHTRILTVPTSVVSRG